MQVFRAWRTCMRARTCEKLLVPERLVLIRIFIIQRRGHTLAASAANWQRLHLAGGRGRGHRERGPQC